MAPELRQFGTLGVADFERVPVWVACHVADYDEPWYDDTDEETFRPWAGRLPIAPRDGTYLVKATATLSDGSSFPAFLTPAEGGELGLVQPQIFVGDAVFPFWGGLAGVRPDARQAFYKAVGKQAQGVFPITFTVAPQLVADQGAIQVDGFYRMLGHDKTIIEL